VTAIAKSGGATVSWPLPNSNGSPITKYVVKTYQGTTLQSTTNVTCAQPCAPARKLVVTGLTNGTSYTFKVAAVNAKGTSAEGATTIKVSASGIRPGVPKNVKAKLGVPGTVKVSWSTPPNGSATINGYEITTFRNGVWQKPNIVVKPSNSRTITGLTAGKKYVFRVAAKNAVGRGPQSPGTAPIVPGASLPGSIAALGDSMTVGFAACGGFAACPAMSWATGTSVNSHYQRILAKNPAISGHVYNHAVPGAPVSALAGQVNSAIADNAAYVTVLIGGNDVCRADESQMTAVATFRSQFRPALHALAAGLPAAKILVVSIPDLYKTWQAGKDVPAAVSAWNSVSFCASMFENAASTAQADVDRRARVRQRIIDDNAVLADECAQVPTCKYDGDALFMHQWTIGELSTVDYIHPSTAGQQVVAELTYTHGYNW
jgi:lysophospholipase L1-like esterase